MPRIDVYRTHILSNGAIRGRHERLDRYLASARVEYFSHDVAGDEAAKALWKRKDPTNELPCVLVDGDRVGSFADLDEAVEYGELRQYLRLDGPPPVPEKPPGMSLPNSPNPSTSSKPSLDDFAALDLTAEEMAALEKELMEGDTFDSGLVSSNDPPAQYSTTIKHSVAPLRITKADREEIDPVTGERIKFVRPMGDRPIGSDAPRDVMAGLEDVSEQDYETLLKELEAEEAQRNGAKEEAPPVPAKDEPKAVVEEQAVEGEPAVQDHQEETNSSEPEESTREDPAADTAPETDEALAAATSVVGIGGASLSAPIEQVEKLTLSSEEVTELKTDVASGTMALEVERPSPHEEKLIEESKAAASRPKEEDQQIEPEQRSTRRDVDALKAELNAGEKLQREAEVPDVVAEVVESENLLAKVHEEEKATGGHQDEGEEQARAAVEDRVAAAIRDGDL